MESETRSQKNRSLSDHMGDQRFSPFPSLTHLPRHFRWIGLSRTVMHSWPIQLPPGWKFKSEFVFLGRDLAASGPLRLAQDV